MAHFRAVIRLDPRRDAAWKRLGFKKVGGRWIKQELQETAWHESQEQAWADRSWKPLLEKSRIGLDGGESIVATGIHRLWKAGKGWTMARELKPGDTLRTLGGLARVETVDAEKKQPVYNFQVADEESDFVGKTGVLAHDNSTIDPVLEPFDAVAQPAADSTAPGRPRPCMLGR